MPSLSINLFKVKIRLYLIEGSRGNKWRGCSWRGEAAAWSETGAARRQVRRWELKGSARGRPLQCCCCRPLHSHAAWPRDLNERACGLRAVCEQFKFMQCENADFRLHLEIVSSLCWRLNFWHVLMHNARSNFISVKKWAFMLFVSFLDCP